MSPFTRNIQSRQIHTKGKSISDYQGLEGGGKWGTTTNGHRVSFWGNENVLQLDSSDVMMVAGFFKDTYTLGFYAL